MQQLVAQIPWGHNVRILDYIKIPKESKDNKLKKVKYLLTNKGLREKLRLTYYFLKQKEVEYNRLKKELRNLEIVKERK